MNTLHTAERVSSTDYSDNYVYQRSLLAYLKASTLVSGKVLEIGTGDGYGIDIIAPHTSRFLTIDKKKQLNSDRVNINNFDFLQMNIPPLTGIPSDTFDFVISFQVIEHIKNDKAFLKEIHRVLKNKGKLIITTPNKRKSLTRNPWHIREYSNSEFDQLLKSYFSKVTMLGIFGNDKITDYYEKNVSSIRKITKYDIFNFQYLLPRFMLKIPYNILNRRNRQKLLKKHSDLVTGITHEDYYFGESGENSYDLFCIAQKNKQEP